MNIRLNIKEAKQEVINTVKAGRYEEAGALMKAICLKTGKLT